jgi:hypothetical protein
MIPAMSGQIESWQRKLDAEGRVRFRQSPWLPLMMVVLGAVLALGPLGEIVENGPETMTVVALLFFAVFGVGFGAYQLVTGRPGFTVASNGIHTGRRVVPFDAIAAVRVQRSALIVDHTPLPGQRLLGVQRRSGLKQLPLMVRGTRVKAGDLATWLLRLKAGPDARVDVRRVTRLGEVYTIADTPWWEQPPAD